MWVWKAILKQTLKLREVLLYRSSWHLWISFVPAQPSNDINRVLLTTCTAATHMPESIGCLPAVSTSSSAGNEIGSGTSASWWPSCTLVILCCLQDVCTISDAGSLPPVYTAATLTRQQRTWCYSAQPTNRPGGTSGQEESLTLILNASGTSWSGLGW